MNNKEFSKSIKSNKKNSVVMLELPTDYYLNNIIESVKQLTDEGYGGVYISFQRPFVNVLSLFEENGVDLKDLFFVDIPTKKIDFEGTDNSKCINISPKFDIDELVKATYESLEKVKSEKVFVYIDSLTTISLFKPLSEIARYSEFLVREIKDEKFEKSVLVLNVSKDLAEKEFIRDIAIHADKVIEVNEDE